MSVSLFIYWTSLMIKYLCGQKGIHHHIHLVRGLEQGLWDVFELGACAHLPRSFLIVCLQTFTTTKLRTLNQLITSPLGEKRWNKNIFLYIFQLYMYTAFCYHNKEQKVNNSWFYFFLSCCFTKRFNWYKEPSYTSNLSRGKRTKRQLVLRIPSETAWMTLCMMGKQKHSV